MYKHIIPYRRVKLEITCDICLITSLLLLGKHVITQTLIGSTYIFTYVHERIGICISICAYLPICFHEQRQTKDNAILTTFCILQKVDFLARHLWHCFVAKRRSI
jgi:hypothetical protein